MFLDIRPGNGIGIVAGIVGERGCYDELTPLAVQRDHVVEHHWEKWAIPRLEMVVLNCDERYGNNISLPFTREKKDDNAYVKNE